MARSLSPESQAELESLVRILRVFADVREIRGRPFAGEMRAAIDKAYEARALGGLRQARNDMLAMADSLPGSELRELDARFREDAGVSLDELQSRRLARIARVRERGRISNDEQYHLLRERVEQVWDDPARADEFEALQALVATYEERSAQTR